MSWRGARLAGAVLMMWGAVCGPALAAQPKPQQAAPPAQAAPPGQPAHAGQANPRHTPVVRVVQEAGPAVVSIVTARVEAQPFGGSSLIDGPTESLTSKLFRSSPSMDATPKAARRNLGSGVIIDGRRALVLTNAHVITGASQITARLMDGRLYLARLVGADQDMDLAVLRLDVPPGSAPLPQAKMGDSDAILIGEPAIAIGNPFGLSHTVTTGVISARDRSVNMGQRAITGLIQTDAAINPGNSGGPLLNMLGEVVGINAAVYARGGGLGFAIPINKAKMVLDELIATGRVAHIWLGLLGRDMTPEQVAGYGLMRPSGVVVTDVFPGTPAEAAGIRPGDALLAIGGDKVRDKGHLLGMLRNADRGAEMAVLLHRGAQAYQVTIRPQVLDREAGLSLINGRWGFAPGHDAAPAATGAARLAGVSVGSVRAEGPAAKLGIKPGDLIIQVGSLRTAREADLLAAFYRYQMHDVLILSVERGGLVYTVRMKL